MKKRLLILVLSIGMMGLTQSKAAISAFCFTDAFGYVADVTATKTAPGHWELSGTANVLTGYDWAVSGSYHKESDVWTLTFTNTMPDGCTFYVDYFTYTSYSYGGGTIFFNWTSYCFAAPLSSGSGSTTWTTSPCAFKTSPSEPIGPMSVDETISSKPVVNFAPIPGGTIFGDVFIEANLTVVNNSQNNIAISYEISDASNVEIAIYNHVGQFVTTIVNENKTEGFYNTYWDGKTTNGVDALEGMYIVVMKSNGESISSKFVK